MKGIELIKLSAQKARLNIVGDLDGENNNSDEFTLKVDEFLEEGCIDLESYINTGGGNAFHAFEIGNQVNRFSGKKTCKLGAICASAGTVIASHFDEVEASQNTLYMIHEPILSLRIMHPEDFESNKVMYEALRNQCIEIYAIKTGLPKEEIEAMMKATTWMDAKKAKSKGFVNSISNKKAEFTPDAKMLLEQYKGYDLPQLALNNEFIKPQISMKKLALKFGLPEDATEDQILAASIKADNDATLKAEGNSEKGVKILVEMAKAKGMDAAKIEKLAKADFDTTHSLVLEFKAPEAAPAATEGNKPETVRMSDVLEAVKKMGESKDTSAEMKFSERLSKDKVGLKAMFAKEPAKVIALFKAEYGKDVEAKDMAAVLG